MGFELSAGQHIPNQFKSEYPLALHLGQVGNSHLRQHPTQASTSRPLSCYAYEVKNLQALSTSHLGNPVTLWKCQKHFVQVHMHMLVNLGKVFNTNIYLPHFSHSLKFYDVKNLFTLTKAMSRTNKSLLDFSILASI